MFYIYILTSLKDRRTYIGHTNNLQRRLKEHNSGHVRSTKPGQPWRLFFFEEFDTLSKAKKRELYWKSGAGRRKLKEMLR